MKVNIVIDSQSTTLRTSWAADRFTFITVLAWWMCLILQLFLVLRDERKTNSLPQTGETLSLAGLFHGLCGADLLFANDHG